MTDTQAPAEVDPAAAERAAAWAAAGAAAAEQATKDAADRAEAALAARAARNARLQALGERLTRNAERPARRPAPGPPPWEDVAAHQRDVAATAWVGDLRAQGQDRLARWTLDDYPGRAGDVARVYVEALTAGTPANMAVTGPVGTGKTSLAIAAGHAAIAAGLRVRFVPHARYLAYLHPGGQPPGLTVEAVRARYRARTELLILDDLCAEMEDGMTTFAAAETTQLLGDRASAGLGTIATTNLTGPQLEAPTLLGERAYSRFAGGAAAVTLTGQDRRAPVTWGPPVGTSR